MTKTKGTDNALVKKFREIGEISGQQESGPGEVPLKLKYASKREIGHTGFAR